MLCRYVTDILKMCMKKFDAEKKFFLTNISPIYSVNYKIAPLKVAYLHVHIQGYEL